MLAIDPAHQAVLDRFPGPLKALVLAELAAGNTILDVGGGYPAPPAGDRIDLARDLITLSGGTHEGLRYHERDSSTHHQEVTDAEGFFWIVTAPSPSPLDPDMNAIRDRLNAPPWIHPAEDRVSVPGSVEMDIRGELLILREEGRRTDIVWTWNQGNKLYRSTLSPWWYPAERRSEPMTEAENQRVLGRFLDHARAHIDANIELRD